MDNQTDIEKFSAEDRKKIVDEQEKQNEELFQVRKNTLENLFYLYGANLLKGKENPLGIAGHNAEKFGYNFFINSDYTKKLKEKLNTELQQKCEQSGFNYFSSISDSELAMHAYELGQEILYSSKSGDLEKMISNYIPDMKIENKTLIEKENQIESKSKEYFINTGKNYELSPDEQKDIQFIQMYKNNLIKLYEKSAAKKLVDLFYYEEEKNVLKQLEDKYPAK